MPGTVDEEVRPTPSPHPPAPPGFPRLTALAAALALVGAVVAVGIAVRADHRAATATAPGQLAVTERNFAIQGPASVAAGVVNLTVHNDGPAPHELLIFRADQPADQLPTGPDGRVDETSDQITKVFDSGDNVNPGGSKTFQAALAPGRYVMICNLPGHYAAGMRTVLTVP